MRKVIISLLLVTMLLPISARGNDDFTAHESFYLAYVQLLEDNGLELREDFKLKMKFSSQVSYNPVEA